MVFRLLLLKLKMTVLSKAAFPFYDRGRVMWEKRKHSLRPRMRQVVADGRAHVCMYCTLYPPDDYNGRPRLGSFTLP